MYERSSVLGNADLIKAFILHDRELGKQFHDRSEVP